MDLSESSELSVVPCDTDITDSLKDYSVHLCVPLEDNVWARERLDCHIPTVIENDEVVRTLAGINPSAIVSVDGHDCLIILIRSQVCQNRRQ